MKLLNGNILTKESEEIIDKTKSGVIINVKHNSYKELEVIEPDINNNVKKGSLIYVPINSGIPINVNDDKYLIVNIKEVILIL